jgi:integrase
LESNPAQGVKVEGYDPGKSAGVVWTRDQVKKVWDWSLSNGDPVTRLALRAHISAGGQRVQEVLGARWEDYDTARGTLTFGNTKMGNDHTIAVGKHLAAVLAEARELTGSGQFIFPGAGDNDFLHHASVTRVVRNILGAGTGPRFLRATVKTVLSGAGVDRLWLDWNQGHTPEGLSRSGSKHYDRSEHLEQKRAVAKAWDRVLEEWLG